MGMDLRAGKKKRSRSTPEMNVTPLVDVVLVLLIIFMVIAPLLSKQFWMHLPDPKEALTPKEGTKEPLVVTVDRQGRLCINRDVVPDAEFPTRLHRALAARRDRTVFFDADDEAPFERAGVALDLARGAGATTIAVATEKLLNGK